MVIAVISQRQNKYLIIIASIIHIYKLEDQCLLSGHKNLISNGHLNAKYYLMINKI